MPLLMALAPELVVIAVAVLAMLIYLAYSTLRQFFGAVFSQWGSIERLVGGAIVNALDAGYNAVKGWLESALHPIVGLFSHPATALDAHTKANIAAAVHLQNVVQFISQVLVPDVTTSILNEAKADTASLQALINQQLVPAIQQSLLALQGELNQDAAALQSLEGQLARLNDTVFGQNLQGEIAGVASVVGTVQTQLAQAYRDLAGQQGQITSTAELAADAYGYTDTQVSKGVTTAEEQSAAYTDALGADALAGLHSGNPALTGTLAASLATVASQAAAATTYVEECGAPLCDWANANAPNLGALFGALDMGVILALVGAAVSNPEGTAGAMSSIAEDIEGLGRNVLSGFGIGV